MSDEACWEGPCSTPDVSAARSCWSWLSIMHSLKCSLTSSADTFPFASLLYSLQVSLMRKKCEIYKNLWVCTEHKQIACGVILLKTFTLPLLLTFLTHLTPFPRAANELSCFQSIRLAVHVSQTPSNGDKINTGRKCVTVML